MGITIHYRGSIENRRSICKFRDELDDISRDMGWNTTFVDPTVIDRDTHPPICGILIDMKNGCELLPFIFDDHGRLRNALSLSQFDDSDETQTCISLKTQFSSVECHIALIKLLRYIKKTYIYDLQVLDEGDYWESSNRDKLDYLFRLLNKKLHEVCDVLEGTKESFSGISNNESLADKLEEIISRHVTPMTSIEQNAVKDADKRRL